MKFKLYFMILTLFGVVSHSYGNPFGHTIHGRNSHSIKGAGLFHQNSLFHANGYQYPIVLANAPVSQTVGVGTTDKSKQKQGFLEKILHNLRFWNRKPKESKKTASPSITHQQPYILIPYPQIQQQAAPVAPVAPVVPQTIIKEVPVIQRIPHWIPVRVPQPIAVPVPETVTPQIHATTQHVHIEPTTEKQTTAKPTTASTVEQQVSLEYGPPVITAEPKPSNEYGLPVAEPKPSNEYGLPVAEPKPSNEYGLPVTESKPSNEYGLPVAEPKPFNEYTLPGTNQPIPFKEDLSEDFNLSVVNDGLPAEEPKPFNEYGLPAEQPKPFNEYGLPVAELKPFNENNGDGEYSSSYVLSDGTKVTEEGRLVKSKAGNSVLVKNGNYEFIDKDGTEVKVDWVADEGGFRIIDP